ncbi:MAG: methyltransferase domain-containing protein [Cyclobacteriaceae bacterium]|nr:methyltransferase domain-containing protein [Cyclobacteriaceae bacterium]
MTVKEHYDTHLAKFYSWMTGDFETKQKEFENFLKDNAIIPFSTKKAVDLGAGHGLQSVPLAKLGFHVIAVDFNKHLLDELAINGRGLDIEIRNDDIKKIKQFADKEVELIVCCGDTLSHLDNKREIENLVTDISIVLKMGGKALLSFRDYSTELTGDSRFIPVKSDDTRILTCVLDYESETVSVTDLLNEKTETGWVQKVSSYNKVRVLTNEIVAILEANRMRIQLNQVINGMTTIIAVKS